MAAIQTRKREKMAQEMLQILVVLHVFQQSILCQPTIESSGQAFVQTDKELTYMVNGEAFVGGIPLHKIPAKSLEETKFYDNPVLFEPPLLEFEEQPVGMPHLEQVTIQNRDKSELHLLSISGSTLHFHCSFFQEKYVPPGGNTTFEVVFLARQVGNVENTLYIHTNVGTFKYQVFGVGISNPYRIRPFLGAKVPLNSSFSPLIKLHNPHSSTLQVEEIYSSGGDLHLQLPSGEVEATKELWEIPPYDTKPIMKANFLGRTESNHTAFIRIKTNKENQDSTLVLPVEVEVSSEAGIYSPLEVLDFGIVRSCDEPKILKLNLINSGVKPLHIHDITVSPPNEAISINFRPTHLKPDLWEPSTVAKIVYNASKVSHARQWNGQLVIHSKTDPDVLRLPYTASVLHGSLSYEKNKTMYFTGQHNQSISRNLPITNNFNFTLVVHSASFPPGMESYFKCDKFKKPVFIKSGQTVSPFLLVFHFNQTNMHFETELYLHTNASTFNIPIYVYNGKLKPVHHRPEMFRGQLDFGTLDMDTEYSMMVTLRNENPVEIVIRHFGANLDQTTVRLLGVEIGNGTTLTRAHNLTEEDVRPLILKSNHYAVFNVSHITSDFEGNFAGEVIVYTQHENLYIPITVRTAQGSLQIKPETVLFEKCFPGQLSYRDLRLVSSFDIYMALRRVIFQPNDTRFYYRAPKDEDIVLEPESDKNIGRIYFDPKLGASGCATDCYVGLSTNIPAGHQWLLGCMLDIETADVDQYLYTRFRQKWAALQQQQTDVVNLTIQLDTNQIRGFLFQAQAHLQWPSLRDKASRIHFPLTQIGNTSVQYLVVENPADVPVLMQFLPLHLYPNPQTILDMLGDGLSSDLNNILENIYTDVFSLQDLEKHDPDNPHLATRDNRQYIEKSLGIVPHQESVALVVGSHTKVELRLGFTPNDHLPKTSLLVIRNNLTILDSIVLHGHGGQGDIKFGNRKVGSSQPLMFEITEKVLKNCDNKKRQGKPVSPNFTVRKPFTAKNSGQLPFYVQGFSINNSPCEGYGFKVLECEGFELQPNASKKVEIVFTPDFTMSRIQRVLTLHTSLGPAINYTLQATIPPHLLTKCSAALPRPSWEPLLYYSIICVMGFFLFCILVAAYFEADRISTADLIRKHRQYQSNNLAAAAAAATTPPPIDPSNVFNLKVLSGVTLPNGVVKPNHIKTVSSGSSSGCNGVSAPAATASTPPLIPRPHSARRKKEPSFLLFNLIKKLYSYVKLPKVPAFLKPFRTENAHPAYTTLPEKESKLSDNPETDSPSSLNKSQLKRENSSSDRDIAAEENQPGNKHYNHKKGKAIKQRHNDPDLIADLREHEMKTSSKNKQDHHDYKLHHNKSQRKVATDNHYELPNQAELAVDQEEEDSNLTYRGKKNRLRRTELGLEGGKQSLEAADRDDTSSTTTDSSLDQLDEKAGLRDSLQDGAANTTTSSSKARKNKKKNNSQRKVADSMYADPSTTDATSDVYLVTSKSRSKKIRVDSQNDLVGQVDLPYMLDSDRTQPMESSKPCSGAGLNGSQSAKNRNTRPRRPGHRQRHEATTAPLHVQVDYEHLPTASFWDTPKPVSPDGDLKEFSLASQQFEAELKETMMAGNSAGVRDSSPLSSFSGVVVSSTDGPSSNTTTPSPVRKLPSLSPVSDMSDGLGGSKSPTQQGGPKSMASLTGNKKNAWVTPSPPHSISPSSGFALEPIDELQNISPGLPQNTTSSSLGLQDLHKLGLGATAPADLRAVGQTQQPQIQQPAPPQQPTTLMQELMADRRRRQQEYQQKVLKDDWPLFGLPAVNQDSPWNQPNGTWTNPMSPFPGSPGSDGWAGGVETPGWTPMGSGWSSSGASVVPTQAGYVAAAGDALRAPPLDKMQEHGSLPVASALETTAVVPGLGTQVSSSQAPPSSAAGFDPYIHKIWNPMPSVASWSFSPPPKPDDDN